MLSRFSNESCAHVSCYPFPIPHPIPILPKQAGPMTQTQCSKTEVFTCTEQKYTEEGRGGGWVGQCRTRRRGERTDGTGGLEGCGGRRAQEDNGTRKGRWEWVCGGGGGGRTKAGRRCCRAAEGACQVGERECVCVCVCACACEGAKVAGRVYDGRNTFETCHPCIKERGVGVGDGVRVCVGMDVSTVVSQDTSSRVVYVIRRAHTHTHHSRMGVFLRGLVGTTCGASCERGYQGGGGKCGMCGDACGTNVRSCTWVSGG